MTIVNYTYFFERMNDTLFKDVLNTMPALMKGKIGRYRRWQDAHASLLGKLLLLDGIGTFKSSTSLNDLILTAHGKPEIKDLSISFNISHSGNYVLCVLSDEAETVGIDVEEIKSINLGDFQNVLTPLEWQEILNGDIETFYEYWTKKEAIIKADGRGLGIPLKNIDVRRSIVSLNDSVYHIKHLDIHRNYVAHLASNCKLGDVQITYIPLHYLVESNLS